MVDRITTDAVTDNKGVKALIQSPIVLNILIHKYSS